MNLEKLFELEGQFLSLYPQGFNDPDMIKLGKKHNVAKLTEYAQQAFTPSKFDNCEVIIADMVKLVSRSSMVSMFEKPKFRDAMGILSNEQRSEISQALNDLLHNDTEQGFNTLLNELVNMKLAKWSLISILPYYYAPTERWFIKPNTTKAILKYFEVDDIIYKPRPSYAFYQDYSAFLDELKAQANDTLTGNNAAFTGFLMMTMPKGAT